MKVNRKVNAQIVAVPARESTMGLIRATAGAAAV